MSEFNKPMENPIDLKRRDEWQNMEIELMRLITKPIRGTATRGLSKALEVIGKYKVKILPPLKG